MLSLLGFELTRGYYLAGDESHYEERRERVYTFMSTPLELEKVSADVGDLFEYYTSCRSCDSVSVWRFFVVINIIYNNN